MKKTIVLILSLFLLLGLCSCTAPGNSDLPDSSIGGDTPGAARTPTEITCEYTYNNDEHCTYYMTLTALDETGETMWVYTSENCLVGQCEGLEYLGMQNGLVYINENAIYDDERMAGDFTLLESHLRALNATDGTTVWDNTDYTGAGSCSAFDTEGNIYIAGYFGPDCIKIDPTGSTVWLVASADPSRFWVYDISYDNGIITVTYEAGDDGEGGIAILDSEGNVIG